MKRSPYIGTSLVNDIRYVSDTATNDEFFDAPDYMTTGGESRYSGYVTAVEFQPTRRNDQFENPAYSSSSDDEGGFMKSTVPTTKSAKKIVEDDSTDDDFGFRYRPAVAPPRPLQASDKSPMSPSKEFAFSIDDTLRMKAAAETLNKQAENQGILLETNLDSEFDKSSLASSYYHQKPLEINQPYQPTLETNIEPSEDEIVNDSATLSAPNSEEDPESSSETDNTETPPFNTLKRSSALWNVQSTELDIYHPVVKEEPIFVKSVAPVQNKFRHQSAIELSARDQSRMLARLDTDFEMDTDASIIETTPSQIAVVSRNSTLKRGYHKFNQDFDDHTVEPRFNGYNYKNEDYRYSVPELSRDEITLRSKSLNALHFSLQSLSNTSKTIIIPGPARRASLRRSKLALDNPGSLYSLTLTGDLGQDNLGFDTVTSNPDDVENGFHHGVVEATEKPKKSPVQRLKQFDFKDVNNRKYIIGAIVIVLIILVGIAIIVGLSVGLSG